MTLQLEMPEASFSPLGTGQDADDCCSDLDLPAFEPRALEILQTLNQMFDQMLQPAALRLSD